MEKKRRSHKNSLLSRALAAHQSGQIVDAILLYRKLLKKDPDNPDILRYLGTAECQSQNFQEADELFRQSLQLSSDKADTWNNRGYALKALDRLDEALECYAKALSINPDYADAWNNRGIALLEFDRSAEALESFDKALSIKPDHAEACINRGNALKKINRLDEALESYDKALTIRPDFAEAWNNRGMIMEILKRRDEALDSYDKALSFFPHYIEAWNNRGNVLQSFNRYGDALESYDKVLSLNPGNTDTWNNRGNALKSLNLLNEALASYEKALAIRPEFAEAYYNRGLVLSELKLTAEALKSYGKAISIKPDYVDAYINNGVALQSLNRPDEALQSYDKALSIMPDYAEIYINRGNALKELNRLDEALESYNKAISIKPDYADAYWNKSLVLLMVGNYVEGWRLYEYRWQTKKIETSRQFKEPLWLGEENLNGKTILIYPEQGLGDFVQCCRFVQMLEARGANVILETPTPLISLLSSMRGTFKIVRQGDELPRFDYQCPIMSLSLAFGVEPNSIPAPIPYIFADTEKTAQWERKLGEKIMPRIGVVWSGSTIHQNDRNRSLLLNTLAPLLALPFEFHSLQLEIRQCDIKMLENFPQIILHQNELKDFSDTAALIDSMDLVITVDTAVAHVAGSMGKPVWILLPFAPDYRWFLGRSDSPWYPTAKLFRQSAIDDWAHVISDITSKAKTLLKNESKYSKRRKKGATDKNIKVLTLLNEKKLPIQNDYELNQALASHKAGQIKEARNVYLKLLGGAPDNPEILRYLGTAECQLHNYQEALKLFEQSLQLSPDQADTWSNRGYALKALGRLDEALECYAKALTINPDHIDAWNNRGIALLEFGRSEEALQSFDKVLSIKPDHMEACNNRGNVLKKLNRLDEALECYDKALTLSPNFAEAWNNRGVVLKEQNRRDESFRSFRKAISIKARYAEAYNNLGNALKDVLLFNEALENFDNALSIKPDYSEALWNKSLLLLLTGQYAEGWRLYEWRWERKESEKRRHFAEPLWLGRENLKDKTILIYPEQGLGDFIQHCRFVSMLEALGAHVILEVPAALVQLVSSMKGNFKIVRKGDVFSSFDYQCPVMSLPLAFGIEVGSIPASIPYLYADSEKTIRWRKKLGEKRGTRIGLIWSGNTAHKNDRNRSIPLSTLAPLLKLPFEFHSIQKEIRPSDAKFLSCMPQIRLHKNELRDFSDTAALIDAMDLIISVDTAVVHISGAMGKPVWILLPFAPDYRWLLDRSDSPWYPTSTLFRQSEIGGWASVISKISVCLRKRYIG